MSEWQDISTAPKDGTILVFGKPCDLVIGNVVMVKFKNPAAYTAAWDELDEAFCVSGGSWLGPFIEPTHWMPLPDPPKDAGT